MAEGPPTIRELLSDEAGKSSDGWNIEPGKSSGGGNTDPGKSSGGGHIDPGKPPATDGKLPCKLCSSTISLNIDAIHQLENIPVHYFCLLFSSGLGQRGSEAEGIKGFLAIDVKREIKRGSRLKCTYCRKKGATVGCAEPRCKKTYHLPCGSAHHSLQQYYDQFKSFCKDHRPSQKTRKPAHEEKAVKSDHNECAICRDRIIRKATGKTLWSPCCGAFHHRNCVQGLAASVGRERFRCPVCSDNSEFLDEMRFYGIYVPEQENDASVESAAQLEEVDRSAARLCHAKLCFCDKLEGRTFHSEKGIWKILQCDVCGSRGIHAKCGGLEDTNKPVWNCYSCRASLRERGQEPVTININEKRWESPRTNPVPIAMSEKPCVAPSPMSSNTPPGKSHGTLPRLSLTLDTPSKRSRDSLSEKSCGTPSEILLSDTMSEKSRDASNSMFKALLASLPAVEPGESSQPSTSLPKQSPRKPAEYSQASIPSAKPSPRSEYKVTITPVIKSQKRRILTSKGPTVSSRPLWPSRKSSGSPRSATLGKPSGITRSITSGGPARSSVTISNGGQAASPRTISNSMQTGSLASLPTVSATNRSSVGGNTFFPMSQQSSPAVLTLHTKSNLDSNIESALTGSSSASLSSATVLSVPRVITHSKVPQNHNQSLSGYQEPSTGQSGATNGINLSVPVKRKNMVEIEKIDLAQNNGEGSPRKEWNEGNCQKITSRTSLTDLITPILDAGPGHLPSNGHSLPQSKASTIANYNQVTTSRYSYPNMVRAELKQRTIEGSRGTLGANRGTSFADLVTPILNSNNHLQVNLKKDHFAVSDEHEVSPGDSDYESSYEVKGAAAKEDLDAGGDGTNGGLEKRNNIVTITKHKKIVLSKNEYDRNGGQLRVTDFYPNKRN